MSFCRILMVTVFVAAGSAERLVDAEEVSVFPFDLVALAKEQQVEGDERWSATRGGFQYRFASEANLEEFNRKPDDFEIQLGGACARMGSLSGTGSVDLFARYNGKLYIFASEGCREGFLKSPEKLLLTDDEPLKPTEEMSKQGRVMVQRFLDSVASADVRDSIQSIEASTSRIVKSGNRDYVNRKQVLVVFPSRQRSDEWWNDSNFAQVASGDDAWFSDSGDTRPMVAVQQRDMKNSFAMHYIGLYLQLLSKDIVCEALPVVTVDGRRVDQFVVYSNGLRKTLLQDCETGRVIRITSRGHGPTMAVIPLTTEFAHFKSVDGLTLPATTRSIVDGKVAEGGDVTWDIVVNGLVDPALFEKAATQSR